MALLAKQVDLVAYDDRGQLLLLAEVKGTREPSEQWAARFRRNLLAHGTLPIAPFFLIATPQYMYFWRQSDPGTGERLPDFTLDAARELRPYYEKFGQLAGTVGGQALELIFFAWLMDLAKSGKVKASEDPSLSWLSEAGLLDALSGARVELGQM